MLVLFNDLEYSTTPIIRTPISRVAGPIIQIVLRNKYFIKILLNQQFIVAMYNIIL